MIVKQIIDEDFVNYHKPSMFIAFPSCTFKCETDCGKHICQNSELAKSKDIEIKIENIVNRYINNPISQAIVCGGLEPFDSWNDLSDLIKELRIKTQDDIVIYTGYKEEEIFYKTNILKEYSNIIIKFGRFIPDYDKHFDDVLGVYLASDNQYARRIND